MVNVRLVFAFLPFFLLFGTWACASFFAYGISVVLLLSFLFLFFPEVVELYIIVQAPLKRAVSSLHIFSLCVCVCVWRERDPHHIKCAQYPWTRCRYIGPKPNAHGWPKPPN